jgi:hypothetical protein
MSRELFRNCGKICYGFYSNECSNEGVTGAAQLEGLAEGEVISSGGFGVG